MDQKPDSPKRRSWRTAVFIILAVVLYAYAIEVTNVNLQEPLRPRRQENLVGLIRQLARPDFLSYETETRRTNISLLMPCPEEIRGSQVTLEGRQLLLVPNCVNTTQDGLQLTGQGFQPNVDGAIVWYPPGLEATPRRVADFKADNQGNFSIRFTMPDVRPTEETQRLEIVEIVARQATGLSPTMQETLVRILETILMAFMASTVGTLLAVPISFLAARNLMTDVKSPLAALMGGIILAPVGAWVGSAVAGWLMQGAALISSQTMLGVGAFVLTVGLTWPLVWLGTPLWGEDADAGSPTGLARVLGALLLLLFGLSILAHLGLTAGSWLDARLGLFGFVGNFIYVISDFTRVLLPAFLGFVGLLVTLSFGSRTGQEAIFRMSESQARLVTLILTIVGTAVLVYGLAYAMNWICLFGVCNVTAEAATPLWLMLAAPALALGVIAGLLSLRVETKRPFPIGTAVYTLTRGTLNVLRSIEPVLMGFVFVVWVGIGPLAGTIVLIIHSIADLGKLFSEQVENISQGPLEAVTATGANRVQTIVYAVIPQVTPHFIAFAFYRWDINVRMSTIIGFVGGGGIGLVLQRATNLTQYRQASVMVIAIALVVVILDYISSKIRSRII